MHASLLPYLYGLAAEASQTGVPLMRFLALEFPDELRAWQDEQSFMLGPSFLVAPVIEPGATTRTVYLPLGEWVDYWRGTLYDGGVEVTVPAPLDGNATPVFVRGGALLPLAPDYDSLVPSTDPAVRTYSGDLVVRIMPSRAPVNSSFTLADGTFLSWDGTTFRVDRNAQPRTIEVRLPDGRNVQQRIDPGSSSFTV